MLIILLMIPSFVISFCVERGLFCQFLSNMPSAVFALVKSFYAFINFPIFALLKLLGIPYQFFLPHFLILLINFIYWYFLICLVAYLIRRLKKH